MEKMICYTLNIFAICSFGVTIYAFVLFIREYNILFWVATAFFMWVTIIVSKKGREMLDVYNRRK
jgi:hypothetical protein